MTKKQVQKKSGGMRKYGRNLVKCATYKAHHTREKNKVKRVLKASGIEEATKWAANNGVSGYLQKIV